MKSKLLHFLPYLLVAILIVFIYLIYKQETKNGYINIDLVKIRVETLSGEWNNYKEIVVDDSSLGEEFEYSFDGGYTWQDSNKYTVTDNGKISVMLKNNEGYVSESISYDVNNIDSKGPTIKLSLPARVYLNSEVNLKEYVKLTDDMSGVNGDIVIEPSTIDTSTIGQKKITFKAVDNAGNKTELVSTVKVIDKAKEPEIVQSTILYRYRTKTIVEYQCNEYKCDYLDENNIVEHVETNVSTGKCTLNDEYLPNGCFVPNDLKNYCTTAFTSRYRNYNDMIVDAVALGLDGKQVDWSITNKEKTNANDLKISDDTNNATFEINSDQYKKEPCSTDEVVIEGYCHAICSYNKKSCPSGYVLDNNICKLNVFKTCSETCEKNVWSDWSDWSTSVVIADSTTQVETKLQ